MAVTLWQRFEYYYYYTHTQYYTFADYMHCIYLYTTIIHTHSIIHSLTICTVYTYIPTIIHTHSIIHSLAVCTVYTYILQLYTHTQYYTFTDYMHCIYLYTYNYTHTQYYTFADCMHCIYLYTTIIHTHSIIHSLTICTVYTYILQLYTHTVLYIH